MTSLILNNWAQKGKTVTPAEHIFFQLKLTLSKNCRAGTSGSLPYFFGYKTECFPFQNDPKHLDPSYKTDLDILDYFGRVKLVS